MSTNVNFPFQFDGRGRTLDPNAGLQQNYVRQLVEQVLFTSPGERVNLPDFGSGLLQLPFAPNSVEMAAATQFSVQAALQKWLSNYVRVQSVTADVDEAIRLHKPIEDFLRQGKEEATSLAEGYLRLAQILASAETER